LAVNTFANVGAATSSGRPFAAHHRLKALTRHVVRLISSPAGTGAIGGISRFVETFRQCSDVTRQVILA
jgi:hypothetical protein